MTRSDHRAARPPRRLALTLAAALAIAAPASTASAHFLWISAERGPDSAVTYHAFFAEQDVPDLPTFLKYIEQATYSADGRPLAADRGEDTFVLRVPADPPRVIDGQCDFGLMDRGGANFRLRYTARLQRGPAPADEPEPLDGLRLRLVAGSADPGAVRVLFDGGPAAGAVVTVVHEDGAIREMTADAQGVVSCPELAEGRAGLLAKWFDGVAGERDGTPYPETRHYATLLVVPPEPAADLGAKAAMDFPPIPEPINSFGGAVLGRHLYVYSGHTGTTHRYHTGTTNPHFYRLDLRERAGWEELPCGPAVQGVALVAHGGALYRVGGMAARNAEGEPHDLISVDDVARFDPEAGTWTDLPPLPEPRSTHDAAVLGDHLYVVGGWSMPGGDSTGASFLDDALRLDLTDPEAGWEAIPAPPVPRRALAVAAHEGKLYAVGGLQEDGKTVTSVDVFDPLTGAWSSGPDLPGPAIQGFAPSAFSVGGRLLASGGTGTVYRLSEAGDAWEPVAEQAVPRITHRLLPGIDGDALIVGGNFAGIPVRFVESIPLCGGPSAPRAVTWEVGLPGEARQAHAVGVVGPEVILAGGNRSRAPHDFRAENLVDDAFAVRLDGTEAEPIGPLPEPRQSAVLVAVPRGRRPETFLLGGIGRDAEGVVRTLGTIDRRLPEGRGWERIGATIPDERGMFGAAVHEGAVWIFGGSVFDPRPGRDGGAFPTEVLRWRPDDEGGTFDATGHRIPRPRRSFAGAVLDGKYYMVGGLGEDQRPVEAVDVFDFATGTWETISGPSRPRVFADLAVLDGRLYLGGGFARDASGHFEPVGAIEVYDRSSGRWGVALEEAPIPADGLRLMAVRGRLLLVGGDGDEARRARLALAWPGGGAGTATRAPAVSARSDQSGSTE